MITKYAGLTTFLVVISLSASACSKSDSGPPSKPALSVDKFFVDSTSCECVTAKQVLVGNSYSHSVLVHFNVRRENTLSGDIQVQNDNVTVPPNTVRPIQTPGGCTLGDKDDALGCVFKYQYAVTKVERGGAATILSEQVAGVEHCLKECATGGNCFHMTGTNQLIVPLFKIYSDARDSKENEIPLNDFLSAYNETHDPCSRKDKVDLTDDGFSNESKTGESCYIGAFKSPSLSGLSMEIPPKLLAKDLGALVDGFTGLARAEAYPVIFPTLEHAPEIRTNASATAEESLAISSLTGRLLGMQVQRDNDGDAFLVVQTQKGCFDAPL